jgi:hypothetical protein
MNDWLTYLETALRRALKPDTQGTAAATFDAPTIPAFAGMAVSLEPDGGVPAPTGAIYLATQ